jgi:enoyl-CoA hydratase/carnithine racemase
MGSFLKIERRGAVVTLTLNQPEMRNVLTGNSAVEEFVAACAAIGEDTSVRAVIVTGAGTVFCAGGNLKDMQRYSRENIDANVIREEYRNGIQRLPLALYNLDVPTIAAVNGPAIGAGCDLACMCDIRLATEQAYFAESFIKLGLIPGDGGAWLLPRVVGMSRAAEMSFTGAAVSAQDAVSYGLVSRLVAAENLLDEANALADRIAANPGPALRMTKRLLREGQHTRMDTLLEMSAGFQALAHKTAHHVEAVAAFVEKRPPVFPEQ